MFNPEPRTPLSPTSDHSSGTSQLLWNNPVELAASPRHDSAKTQWNNCSPNHSDCSFTLHPPDRSSLGEGNLSRSSSVSSGLNVGRKSRVKTIFPHTAGNNDTLLSFDDGDIITLLIHEEKDGWLYGELEKTQQWVFYVLQLCTDDVRWSLKGTNFYQLCGGNKKKIEKLIFLTFTASRFGWINVQ